jgi:flagellar biosynthesis/type III secretory pathway M-ring protein FliF/YscJ
VAWHGWWGIILGVALSIVVVAEIDKAFLRRRARAEEADTKATQLEREDEKMKEDENRKNEKQTGGEKRKKKERDEGNH